MGEIFELRFKNNEDLTVSIDEPINFATVDFQLSQKDKGYGRDVSFNGGETQFEFVKYRNHYLDKLLTYNKTYGFESIVELIITSGTISTIIGELDFATAITDDLEYFKCKVIQQSSKQVIKRRKAIKIDLLGSKDVDGNYLAPLVPENVLLHSKPIYQVSTWSQNIDTTLEAQSETTTSINPAKYLNKYEIADSFAPVNDLKIITAKSKLENVNVRISNLSIFAYLAVNLRIKIIAQYGVTLGTSSTLTIYDSGVLNGDNLSIVLNEEGNIPSLKINDSLWLYLEFYHEYVDLIYPYLPFDISGMEVHVSGENTVYNSVVPAFRLIDVMKKVLHSISTDLLVVTNRFDVGGEFYNNFVFNGNSLRVLPDKPFYVSLEDIEKSIVEMNADWEIEPDGDVFFGIEDDYYTDIECGKFTDTQFSQMNKTFNPRFQINEFNYGYKNFQSLKENEEPNSADVIHGESKWSLGNKSVENKKDISIEWTRDAFLIETNRRKSLEITEGTASQDDTDLFVIDTIANSSDTFMFYEPILSHSYANGILTLSSTGDINFRVAGMRTGDIFWILSTFNTGSYVILSVSDSSIGLVLTSGSTPTGSTVPSITSFRHTLKSSNTPYVMATSGSFTELDNLIGSANFANLKYSVRRNIESYWKKYLSTCNLYHNYNGIANSWYKNNDKFTGKYGDVKLTEREVIDTYGIKPLLTPFIYNDVIFSNVEFRDFITLQNKIRTDRGYILTKDNNGNDLKLYPMNMKYDNLSRELMIKGEEKFDTTIVYPQLVPNISTLDAYDVTFSSVKLGGFIKSNGGNAVTSKGIVYDVNTNPTISLTTKTEEGSGSADFISNIPFLEPLKTYYARAYAQNGIGSIYGNEISFTTLGEAQIGSQIWTLRNLEVTTYRDGTPITQVTSPYAWSGLTTGAWCYYDGLTSGGDYGKLYNWYAVNDTAHGGIAPIGYHVPTLSEANVLVSFLGGATIAGGKMKESGLTHWSFTSNNIGATNSSNFYGLPSGRLNSPIFQERTSSNYTWLKGGSGANGDYFKLSYANTNVVLQTPLIPKHNGMAVRLIKD